MLFKHSQAEVSVCMWACANIKNVERLSKQCPDKPLMLTGYQSLKFREETKHGL